MRRILFLLVSIATFSVHAPAQRLPELATPENYNLTIQPNFTSDDFTGDETIQIRVLKPTSEIILNSAEIEFREASISAGSTTQTAKVTIEKEKEMAVLAVDQPIAPGPATIFIRYRGIFNGELRGFYLSRVGGRKYAITQFEATDARRAFPCFDEPAYKATFDVTVVTEQGLVAISNGKVIADAPGPGATQHTIRFSTTPRMSSYLVALAVGEFESIAGEEDGIPIHVWTTAGKTQQAGFALEVARYSLHFFDQYFEIKYPFGKLDMIEVPDFSSGAMENTAAIVFHDTDLLLDTNQASVVERKNVATTVAHEISHQWFGDLVTMAWWDDLWLNEGFANWMQSKPIAAWKPEWHVELDDVKDSEKALGLDALASTHPIHQEADTPDRINELFDDISYRKAAAVLRMVEHYVGAETFRSGVNLYLRQHAYGNATSQDFWKALAAASRQPVENIMVSFVNQPGAPLVSANAVCENNSTRVTLSQRRYFSDRRLFAAGSKELWAIPVCLKLGSANSQPAVEERCKLLTAEQDNFEVPGKCAGWLMANAQSAGYYRSSYPPSVLREISDAFETELQPQERITLLGDVWASVRIGQQSVADYLEFVQPLRTERNYAVMDELTEQLDYVAAYLVTDVDRASYQNWLRQLLQPAALELGWKPLPSESNDRKALRPEVLYALGHAGGDAQVLAEASRLAKQALVDPASVDSSLSATVFALAAENGRASFYDRILRRMKETSSGEEYSLLMETLPRFRDPELLSRTLQFALTPEVRGQDVAKLIAGVMENPAGQKLGWDFLRTHWEEVRKAVPEFDSSELVQATGTFCESGLRNQAWDFFANHKVPPAERTLQQALERMDSCLDLKAQQAAPLAVWLKHESVPAKLPTAQN